MKSLADAHGEIIRFAKKVKLSAGAESEFKAAHRVSNFISKIFHSLQRNEFH